MSNNCILCGEQKAAWPAYLGEAEPYPMCEHHISRALGRAEVVTYTRESVELLTIWSETTKAMTDASDAAYAKAVQDICDSVGITKNEYHNAEMYSSDDDDQILKGHKRDVAHTLISAEYFHYGTKEHGKPALVEIGRHLDHAELDAYLIGQIEKMARRVDKKEKIQRCRYRHEDGRRCRNYIGGQNEHVCDMHSAAWVRKGRSISRQDDFSFKVAEFLKQLRSESAP